MAKQPVDQKYYEILADPANIGLACEVYSRLATKRKSDAKHPDAVLAFLQRSENAELVSTICAQFPGVLIRLVRNALLTQMLQQCREKMENNAAWRIDPWSIGENSKERELYPGIELSPIAFDDRPHWSFYLELEGRTLPMKFCHGINFSEKGGQPKKLGPAIAQELEALKPRLQEHSLEVRLSLITSWFARSSKPYDQFTLGDKPQVVSEIQDGLLAAKVIVEFMTLFEQWWEDVTRLNVTLNKKMAKR
jgi:hypothetical protein